MPQLVDIAKVGNVVQITRNTDKPICYSNVPSHYYFSNDGLIFTLFINGSGITCNFSELTITGAAPASVASAYTSLSTIFSA